MQACDHDAARPGALVQERLLVVVNASAAVVWVIPLPQSERIEEEHRARKQRRSHRSDPATCADLGRGAAAGSEAAPQPTRGVDRRRAKRRASSEVAGAAHAVGQAGAFD
eukprot:38105-Chlamydomonas_euryale.AAC.2